MPTRTKVLPLSFLARFQDVSGALWKGSKVEHRYPLYETNTRYMITGNIEPGTILPVQEHHWREVGQDPNEQWVYHPGARVRHTIEGDTTSVHWSPSERLPSSCEYLKLKRPGEMPLWAARMHLRVLEVKQAQLHEIDEIALEREGMGFGKWLGKPMDRLVLSKPEPIWRARYISIWDQGHKHILWSSNPRVLVLTFEVLRASIQ